MATCGNCGSKHTVQGVRACYAARYSADAPRGYVATAKAASEALPDAWAPARVAHQARVQRARTSQPPAAVLNPALAPEEAEALARRQAAAEGLVGARYRSKAKGTPAAKGPSILLRSLRGERMRSTVQAPPF